MNEKGSDDNCGRCGGRPPCGGIMLVRKHRRLS